MFYVESTELKSLLLLKKRFQRRREFSGEGGITILLGSNSALALDSQKKKSEATADKRNFGKGPLLRNSPKKWKSRAEMATMVDVVFFFFSLSDVLLSSSKSSSSSFELLLGENQSMQFYPAPPSTLGLRDRNEVSATLHFVSNYFHW